MRGAGKTHLGRVAAKVLSLPYTDADDVFTEHTGLSVSDYVAANDWPAFRKTETEILKQLVTTPGVISLGGGVVESPEARDILTHYVQTGGLVVHITRDMAGIEHYLDSIGSTAVRPNWGESFTDVYQRRAPWYRQCSSHEFYNTLGDAAEPRRFFQFITGKASRPTLGPDTPTTFLSLTFPDVTPALAQIDELTEGADAIELRVDLLAPGPQYIPKQLAALRLASPLPIVYSVRSKDQGGKASSTDSEAYKQLVLTGLRAGCEYVDLEVCWDAKLLDEVVKQKGHSQIIASWHDWTGEMKWNGSQVAQKYNLCSKYGDVIKIVGTAKSIDDNLALASFVSSKPGKPLLAINMGAKGQLSRIINPILTPVTHPLLPTRAAPGQLSAKQVNTARALLGLLPTKRFFLFGKPIAASVSPTLHNTGFETLGLPHVYDRYETDTIDRGLLDRIGAENFGGASVTIPLKLDIIPHLTTVSPDAELIGAVNTIVPRVVDGRRELRGENTDWQAIAQAASSVGPGATGLVIGAGGTCRAAIYALSQLGAARILLFNRTPENAEKIKAAFPNANIEVITSLESIPPPTVIVSTVPGDSLTSTRGAEGIYIDPKVVFAADTGVVIDMAYKPYQTALLQFAREGWKSVPGVEILCLQGFLQFELWTGKRAPKEKIRQAVMEAYFA